MRLGRRGSLRTRILLTLVTLSVLPAALALLLSFFAAIQTIEFNATSDAQANIEAMAQQIDTAIMQRARFLRESLDATALQHALERDRARPLAERGSLPSAAVTAESGLGPAVVYFMGADGIPFGFLRGVRLEEVDEPPRGLAIAVNRQRLADLPDGSVQMMEAFDGNGLAELWLVGRVKRPDPADPPLYGAIGTSISDVLMALDRAGAIDRRRMGIFSQRNGLAYAPAGEPGFLELAKERAPLTIFFAQRAGLYRMKEPSGFVAAFSQLGRANELSVRDGQPSRWAMVQVVDLPSVTANVRAAAWAFAASGIVLVAAVAIFGLWAADRLVRPITELVRGVERFAEGELAQPVEIRTGDELEMLADSFNKMAATLEESYKRLADKILQLDENARQLALTHRISRAINQSLDIDRLFEIFVSEVRELIPVDRISLGILTADGRDVELRHVFPPEREVLPRGSRLRIANTRMRDALTTGSVIVHHVDSDTYVTDEEEALGLANMRVYCVLPLIGTGGPLGILGLSDADPNRFGPTEVRILSQLAQSVAVAVEHGQLFDRVSRFAAELEHEVEARTRDLKSAQDQLVQVEKFAATGKVAASLAHEINNPLSIIKNYLAIIGGQVLRPVKSPQDLEVLRDGMKVIEEEIDRIARIVAQLRQLQSPHKPVLKDVDINKEVTALAELFRATLSRKKLTLRTELDPRLGIVTICGDHVRQILLNLLTNASDAMDAGGIITIRTQMMDERPGYFSIRVTDTGHGIPAENLVRIFDPFFTTKKDGKGTGLGLSVSYGLATQMGGQLSAASTPGQGTTMVLSLPMRPPAALLPPQAPPPVRTPGEPGPDTQGDVRTEMPQRGRKIILG
jgi:signal transduction histidine kinase